MSMKLFFSVGEPSGDVHAAHLVAELRTRMPRADVTGYGGPRMEKVGCRLDFRMTDLAVMGIRAVVPHLWRFYRLAKNARRIFRDRRPDAVVLVDFPGFNWWIARYAHAEGIPVFYYLPPQIWAWGSYRVARMQKHVDHVLCCFPFERQWYADRGVAAEFVGHPVFDEIAGHPYDEAFQVTQRSRPGKIVGILPGSRDREVRDNFPIQLEVVAELFRRNPHVRCLVANYKQSQRQFCEQLAKSRQSLPPIEYHVGRTADIIQAADVCAMVSGSVSLEMLAHATPAVVLYRSSWSIAWFCRHVIECSYISLPNLFAGRMLLPEYYIVGPTQTYVRQIVDQLAWWLEDESEWTRRKRQLEELRDQVCIRGAIARAADSILGKLLAQSNGVAA